MASRIKNDFAILAEEKFDFDLSLSPTSEKGDMEEEDEVFVGPVGHREKCISVGIESHLTEGSSGSSGPLLSLELGSWSPLTGDKFEQIIQEAHLLARRIGTNAWDELATGQVGARSGSFAGSASPATLMEMTEPFEGDPMAKLSALRLPPAPLLSPIKRETICIRDSPLKQLPPAIQQRLLKAGGLNSPGAARAMGRGCSPIRASQTKAALRGKVGLSSSRGLLPSRPAIPGKVPPSNKGRAGQKHSPLCRTLSSAGSSDDLLSDASIDSLNTSLQERRVLPGPGKVGQPPVLKPLSGLRTMDRRKNTSSSSSSVSSLNSSKSVSPSGKGALNSSLSSGVTGRKLKGPAGVSRLASTGASARPRASSVSARAAEAVRAGRPTPSTLVKRAGEQQAGPAKKRDPAPLNLTPAKWPVQRAGSVPNIATANPKPKAFVTPTLTTQAMGPRRSEDLSRVIKPKKLLAASNTESVLQKAVVPAPETLQTPTAGKKAVSALPRRSSALPTPVSRRVSGIPMMTPKSVRPGQAVERTAQPGSARKISQGSPFHLKVVQRPSSLGPEGSPREDDPCGTALLLGSLVFNLEDELGEVPAAVSAPGMPEPTSQSTAGCPSGHGPQYRNNPVRSTEKQLQSQEAPESSLQSQETPESSVRSQDSPEPSLQVQEIPESSLQSQKNPESSIVGQKTPESSMDSWSTPKSCSEYQNTLESDKKNTNSSTQQVQRIQNDANKEVLLVDAVAPVLRTEERLLIDLSNTPDLIKTAPPWPTGGQLIDLSSPLITWSPVDKKGNTVDSPPLINLSF